MPRPDCDWIEKLPTDRLIGEFSLWSADLTRLADELVRIEEHADLLHLDVADGVLSPSLLFFPDLVATLRTQTAKPIHVHLMVDDRILITQIEQFAEAGADLISFHLSNSACAPQAFSVLTRLGIPAGMVVEVQTPVSDVVPFLPHLRFVTLLQTAIGVKGQSLHKDAVTRLRTAKDLIVQAQIKHRVVLAADGGIREHTVPALAQAGAETVVLGSLAFGAPDLATRMSWLYGFSKH